MLRMLRHTNSLVMRCLAQMLIVFFCTVRIAAAWHTHDAEHTNLVGNNTGKIAHSYGLSDDKESLPQNSAHNDDCPLCHLFSQGAAEIALFALLLVLVPTLIPVQLDLPSSHVYRFLSRLSDRAPPRLA